MSNATSNSKTFTSLVQLLDDCNAHILGKCFRIYNSAIVQHNLTVESIKPLLPAELDVFMAEIKPEDIVKAQIKAKMSNTDYVEPLPYLVISKAKDKTQDIQNTLNKIIGNDSTTAK